MKYIMTCKSKILGNSTESREISNEEELNEMVKEFKSIPQDRHYSTTIYIQSEDGKYFNQIL